MKMNVEMFGREPIFRSASMSSTIEYNAYQTFAKKVVKNFRFTLDKESLAFQSMLQKTAKKRASDITGSEVFYRARKGYDKSSSQPSWFEPYKAKDMEAPPPDKAFEGRINPKGIPYFYAANDMKTAIMEIRPWIGEFVSITSYSAPPVVDRPNCNETSTAMRSLRIVDLTSDNEKSIEMKQLFREQLPDSSQAIERQIWSEINYAFAKPISNDDEIAEYAPSQIISEWFKHWGYDGVAYKSSVNPEHGKSYAFFNPSLFTENQKMVDGIYKVTNLDCKFNPANTILSCSKKSD